jgi:beta-galactosidase
MLRWPWSTNMKPAGIVYGADYNPDQWPEDTWPEDADLMVEAGVTMVTLPVFSWARLEPAPGEYDFGWLDRVLDLLWSRGIRADLATATATPPAWLVRAYPEVLPVTATGVRLEFGSRQTYCPSSPVFRQRTLTLCRAMAARYGGHPGLAMWHVSNEYGDELSRCWCAESARHFRSWLARRYGDVRGLNAAWGTDCWGQRYTGWDQIEPPRASTGPVNPAQRLDFERFSSDALIELFTAEAAVLREITPDVPVTTNFMGLFRDVDYGRLAELEDVVTNDAYPDPADPDSHVAAALGFSLMRSLKPGTPWLLLEQAPSAVSWRDVNTPKLPGQTRLTSLQAVAHGANGIMFFQWRAARSGAERFHSAMLGHRGTKSRTWAECRQLGADLARLAEVTGTSVAADVALLASWPSWWSLDAPDSLPSRRLSWIAQLRAWHAALFSLLITADVIPGTTPLDGYRVLAVPNLFLTEPDTARVLTDYVAAGGTLIVGPFSGVVDECDAVHAGGAPGPLRNLLGVEVDEPWPLPDGVSVTVTGPVTACEASIWAEAIEPVTAEVVATYLDGPLAGRPAITRNRHGAGAAWYVSTVLSDQGLRDLFAQICGVDAPMTVPRPEIITRSDGESSYTFVLNHATEPATVTLPTAGVDLLTGQAVSGTVTVPTLDALVIHTTGVHDAA